MYGNTNKGNGKIAFPTRALPRSGLRVSSQPRRRDASAPLSLHLAGRDKDNHSCLILQGFSAPMSCPLPGFSARVPSPLHEFFSPRLCACAVFRVPALRFAGFFRVSALHSARLFYTEALPFPRGARGCRILPFVAEKRSFSHETMRRGTCGSRIMPFVAGDQARNALLLRLPSFVWSVF